MSDGASQQPGRPKSTRTSDRAAGEAIRPAPDLLIDRPRVLGLIDRPGAVSVTLIVAPAGYGKSTIVAQWVGAGTRNAAWIALNPGCNDPNVFLAQLAAAVGAVASTGDAEARPETTSDLITLLRESSGPGAPRALILDDYHLIENRDVHRIMDGFVAALPPDVHLLMLSRTMPPVALGRLRVEGRVRQITDVDLRFTDEEAQELIGGRADRLNPGQVGRLVQRTDGWIAGIRLAILAIDRLGMEQIDTLIDSLSEHQWLDDYIVEEVLNTLPEELRAFVLDTVGLEMLDPGLCDAVLGIDHSVALIDEAMKRLVFTRRAVRAGSPVTYHPLFADCVKRIAKRHRGADELKERHRRAAVWFARQGHRAEAIEHAVAAGDWDLAQQVIRDLCRQLRAHGQTYSVIHWLAKLPDEILTSHLDLTVWKSAALLIGGQVGEAMRLLKHAEHALEESDDSALRAELKGCQAIAAAHQGELDQALELTYRRLRYTAPGDHGDLLQIWAHICELEFLRGNHDVAEEAYRNAAGTLAHLPAEQRWWTVYTQITRTNHMAIRGDLESAHRHYRHELDHLPGQYRDALGRYHYRLAAIALEWNDLEQAQAEVERFLPDLEVFPWQVWFPEAWLTAAKVYRAAGYLDAAQETMKHLLELMREIGETHIADRARALQAIWSLEDGDLPAAHIWAEKVRPGSAFWAHTFGENSIPESLIHLRVAERDFAEAFSLLQRYLREGNERKRWAELVRLRSWEVAVQLKIGNEAAARDALREALRLGMPGRFVRSFFPPVDWIEPFYSSVRPALPATEAAYLGRLLGERQPTPFLEMHHLPPVANPALLNLLTSREREVLALARDGLTNREIADRLYIGESTIKKHLARSFVKLDVTNRTAAVSRAQEIGLLT
jgi:LuxR family maltose regulon positive regulatory protein